MKRSHSHFLKVIMTPVPCQKQITKAQNDRPSCQELLNCGLQTPVEVNRGGIEAAGFTRV